MNKALEADILIEGLRDWIALANVYGFAMQASRHDSEILLR